MSDDFSTLVGQLAIWPSKEALANILESSGLRIAVGRYCVRIEDCERFCFEQYGGDLGDPIIAAEAETADRLIRDAQRVSSALAAADLRHRFEIYDGNGHLAAYLHHRWPVEA